MDELSTGAGATHRSRRDAELHVALHGGIATFPGGDVCDDGRRGMRVRWTGADGRVHVEHVGPFETGLLARSARLPAPPAVPAEATAAEEQVLRALGFDDERRAACVHQSLEEILRETSLGAISSAMAELQAVMPTFGCTQSHQLVDEVARALVRAAVRVINRPLPAVHSTADMVSVAGCEMPRAGGRVTWAPTVPKTDRTRGFVQLALTRWLVESERVAIQLAREVDVLTHADTRKEKQAELERLAEESLGIVEAFELADFGGAS